MKQFQSIMSEQFTAEDAQLVVLALLEHISEPAYVPKGVNRIALDVSVENDAATPEKKKMSYFMNQGKTIKFKPIPNKPNLEMYKKLDRSDNISLFIPFHKHLAAELTTMLMDIHDLEEFFATAAYCRDQINGKLFVYSFSVALLHRSDTRNLRIPLYAQVFPDKFLDSDVFPTIYEKGFMDQMEESDPLGEKVKEMKVPENRLAYFREDLRVNLHHMHWHLVYPGEGKKEVVNKDRRGELFYYMHQQIVARMCNQLPRVRRLANLRESIEEAYFPKLFNAANNNFFAARPKGAILKLNYKGIHVTSLELITHKTGDTNTIQTFWQEFEVEVSRGVNFMVNRSVVVKLTRLQHDQFKYRFKVSHAFASSPILNLRVQQSKGDECSGSSYCGVRDKLYPDRRSMGFPFDRLPKNGVTTLEKFLTPNMTTVDVKIHFTNSMQ
ncbi:hypothetical protein B566_EDAN009242 [Ephemera danica]|nr:hypothetical protein B566_EDAN009242 [Ephemera danica]